MDKTCLIKQPAGIGDILFCQKIAKVIQEETEYKKIIWPVSEQYCYLKDYLISDNIDFPLETDNFPYKDFYNSGNLYMVESDNVLFVPLQSSDVVEKICKCHNNSKAHGHMKYNFCNVSYSDWKNYFELKRNYKRENDLISKLELDINKPYNLINKNSGTYPNYSNNLLSNEIKDIVPNNNFKNVYMEFYDGVNIFDWMKIFEYAREIHTMECGVYYILEKMNLDNVFIYTKYINQNDDFSYMRDHCNPKWRYIN